MTVHIRTVADSERRRYFCDGFSHWPNISSKKMSLKIVYTNIFHYGTDENVLMGDIIMDVTAV